MFFVYFESLFCEVGFFIGVIYEGGTGFGVGGLDVVFEYIFIFECSVIGFIDIG